MADQGFEYDDTSGDSPPDSAIQQLRTRADQAAELEKELKKLRKENADLAAFREQAETDRKSADAKAALEAANLEGTEAQVKSYLGAEEGTSVQDWAAGLGISVKPVETTESQSTEGQGFQPTDFGTPPGPGAPMSERDLAELHRKNPAAALVAIQEGKVDFGRSPYDQNRRT